MKKILFFETNEFTGATRVTRTLAKAAAKDYNVAFATVGENVNKEIESAILRESPDILFSSFVTINPNVINLGKANDLEVIIRTDYKLTDLSDDINFRIRKTYPFADLLVAQTTEMAEDLKGIKGVQPARVKVIENPLDEEIILQGASAPNPFPHNGNFHFLWVGRKVPIKDLPTLHKAFSIVKKEYPKTDLTVISDDPNPYKWMRYADCLVISSLSEASPNVLREALFLDTVVVSTDCSTTVRKLLPQNRLCPVQNVNALAVVMKSVICEKIIKNNK